ncbi:DNA repair protein RecO [Rhodobacterales bacterium HKCCE3408]|nr:DNA repair protein RecO [Rhodobacterales bacterium HKCCE3408]
MEWREEGVLLAVHPHGESGAIIEVFTAGTGRYAGLVRGGASRRLAPVLQPGAQLDAAWRARLSEHLGQFTVEPVRSRAGALLGDRIGLAGLSAITALLSFCLPERVAYPALYARSVALLDGIGAEGWGLAYLGWERALLEEMGFGLDLTRCAVTGSTEDLAFVSPRTGRAVSRSAAGEWAGRLLPLPESLRGGEAGLAEGLQVTGHFLHGALAASLGDRPLPAARDRLATLLSRV